MKKFQNNFTVSGFVGKDAEIRQFTNASVARFPLAIGRQETNGDEPKRVSAFVNMEVWRKNEHTESFDQLAKGAMLTFEGYFKPEEMDRQGRRKAQPRHHGCHQVLSRSRRGRSSCRAEKGREERQEIIQPSHKAAFGPFFIVHLILFIHACCRIFLFIFPPFIVKVRFAQASLQHVAGQGLLRPVPALSAKVRTEHARQQDGQVPLCPYRPFLCRPIIKTSLPSSSS